MSNSPKTLLSVVALLAAISAGTCEAQTHVATHRSVRHVPATRTAQAYRPAHHHVAAAQATQRSVYADYHPAASPTRHVHVPVQYEAVQYAHEPEFIEHDALMTDSWSVVNGDFACNQCAGTPIGCDHACGNEFSIEEDLSWLSMPARESRGCLPDCDGHCLFQHQHRIFFHFLVLSTGNADLRYATPVDGGGGGFLRPGSDLGFRVGGSWRLSDKSSLDFTLTSLDTDANGSFPPGGFLIPHSTRPGTATGATSASAGYEIDMRTFDIDFRHLILGDCCFALNSRIGARIGSLDQTFNARYRGTGGSTFVDSDVDFSGAGPRFRLDLEKKLNDAWTIYTRSSASFMVGEFEADYTQAGTLSDEIEDSRIVPTLDFELGLSFISQSGRFRMGAGYLVSAWFNTLPTDEVFRTIRNPGYSPGSETITFSGLTTHVEIRF